eukprot:gene5467-7570_t
MVSICLGVNGFGFINKFIPQSVWVRKVSFALKSSTSSADLPPLSIEKIALSGFVSKQENSVESFALNKLFEKLYVKEITVLTDDLQFAKKRLVNPKTVYSGLIDVLKYSVVDSELSNFEAGLADCDSLISLNVSSSNLLLQAKAAVNAGLKRVVFGVNVNEDEAGENVVFNDAKNILSVGNVIYTIIKYKNYVKMEEARFPYRIVRDVLPLPSPSEKGTLLSSEDLMRVLVEIVDLPKSFNQVYGIGPGNNLDSEILIYMKSQGWPERVQVGLLVGDMMESIEKKYQVEMDKQKSAEAIVAKGNNEKKVVNNDILALPQEDEEAATMRQLNAQASKQSSSFSSFPSMMSIKEGGSSAATVANTGSSPTSPLKIKSDLLKMTSLGASVLPFIALQSFLKPGAVKAVESVDENVLTTDFTVTESGLKYKDIKVGDGAIPLPGDTVRVHYTGWLDGFRSEKKFDSSYDRRSPLVFKVGVRQVIAGWDEALLTNMKVGGKRDIEIPSVLGYGTRGAGGVIPPNATLYFTIELVGIGAKPKK